MRVTFVVAVILMALSGVGAFMGWSQQDTQGNARAAQTAVEVLWTAISRGGRRGRYRLPANTPPLVGPEGPSDRLVTVVARYEKGAWKVIATAVPR